ncbi:TusE/DsrC/DsvC family sulfur relay protein [Thalassovita sp.]|uniref:TusE/DsrC/DsvC family sulfur relay protein n=1 Tax=Thalassovita sp. TaxID=1979401 RepID=UPI0029DE786D|nr:TusE/DsrC/DsvC family sulfur relay protein [Thalassovita sp.]
MRTRPDKLTRITLPTGSVLVDEYGYLTDPDQWTPEFAETAAASEGVPLGPEHWDILRFMRDFHDRHGVAADQRFVLKQLSDTHQTDKATAKQRLYTLFPGGYVKQACKIAGMRQPRAWSTG